MQNHIASFLLSFCFWMEAKWYLGMETCFKTNGSWGNFNGERDVPESLPARTEMIDDYFLSSGLLVRGAFFFFFNHLLPYHRFLGDSKLETWISFLKVLSSLWENSSKWMTMSTGLSPRRGLSWLKVDSWSDALSWIYWNPPKSSRPGLDDTAPPLPELGAQRWGARASSCLVSRAPQHPRWGHGVATVQGAINSLALLKLQCSHLPLLPGPGNHPTFIVWSVFSHQMIGTLNVLGKYFKKTNKPKMVLWGHSWEIKLIFIFKFLIV